MSDETLNTEPPNNLGAEQAALGAMLLSRPALVEISEILTAEQFYRPNHGKIFTTIVDLDARGEPADAYTVAAALAEAGDLARIGGTPYLHTLIETVPTAVNGAHYARLVAEQAMSRDLQTTIRRMLHLATTRPAKEALEKAQQLLADLEVSAAPAEGGPRMWADLAPEVLDEIEKAGQGDEETPGVPTGFIDLDRLLNGLHPGQVVVVGARPGVGKSILLAGIAQHVSWKKKLPALLFSLEMSGIELGTRLISADSRVPLHVLQSGQLSEQDWSRVTGAVGESAPAPLAIDDTAELTIAEIRARARKMHRQFGGLALVAIDYLQLISAAGRGENRQVIVAGISRGLKLLAKQLNVPVIVASQLNRGPEQRADKRPQLSDLRESGSIEADADVVILIHRDDYHDQESTRAGEADFIVEKNRRGPRDTVTVAAQLHLARFVDMAVI